MCSANPFTDVGDLVGDVTGSKAAGSAAQSSAEAQQSAALAGVREQKAEYAQSLDFAKQARAEQEASRTQAVNLAGPSAQELSQMGINLDLQYGAISKQFEALNRDQSILDAVDPSIKESGKQALELLQGKQAQAVQPVLDQRQRARSQLEQTLADRLGPDYAQSSAGSSALRNFDNDTSTLTNQVQQQTLGTLLGVSQNASNALNPVSNVGNAFSTLGSLNAYGLQGSQNVVSRQVNAFTGNPVNQQLQFNPVNYGSVIQTAGAGSVGALYSGQAQQQLIGQIGGTAAGIGVAKAISAI